MQYSVSNAGHAAFKPDQFAHSLWYLKWSLCFYFSVVWTETVIQYFVFRVWYITFIIFRLLKPSYSLNIRLNYDRIIFGLTKFNSCKFYWVLYGEDQCSLSHCAMCYKSSGTACRLVCRLPAVHLLHSFTTVQLHSHGNSIVPSQRHELHVTRTDLEREYVRHNGVPVRISKKNLQESGSHKWRPIYWCS